MRGDQFDSFVRRFAEARQTRRVLLTGIGGASAVALGLNRADASPARPAPGHMALRQEIGAGVVGDQAFLLNYDVDKIFRFVADEIAFEPYDGVLRGAEGTLRSRAGNSLDKALLLGELLSSSNIDVQYGTAQLTPDAATALARSIVVDRAELNRRELVAALGALPLASDTARETPPATPIASDQSTIDSMATARSSLLTFAKTSADESIALLTPAATGAAISTSLSIPELSDLQKANHGWVAYPFGTDWMQLDPTTPGARPAKMAIAPILPAATPDATTSPGAFPELLYHTVSIRLIGEQVQGTSLVTADLVAQQFSVADIDGLPITIAHMGATDLQGLGVAINSTVDGSFTQIPLVAIGDQVFQGNPYLVFGGAGGGVLGALGSDTALTDGEPTAEWLQIDATAPDGSTTTARRVIFDRIGDANRADPAEQIKNLKPIELVEYGNLGKVYLPLLAVTSLAISGADSAATRFSVGQLPSTGVGQQANMSHAIQHYLYRLASNLGPSYGLRIAPNGINISSVTLSAVEGSTGDNPLVSTDVWQRKIVALPVADETPTASPELVIASLGLAAEELAVDSSSWTGSLDMAAMGLTAVPAPVITVRTVFAAAKSTNVPIVTIAPTDDLATSVTLDPADLALPFLQADLDGGRTIVVPATRVEVNGTPRIGWWAIDPSTGTVIDRMDSGGSAAVVMFQTLAEYITVLRNGMAQAEQWRRLGCIGAVVTMLAAMLLGAPFAGYKAAEAADAGNYGQAVVTALGGEIAGVVAFIRAPAACLVA